MHPANPERTVVFIGSGFSKAIFEQKIQSELLTDFLTSPESDSYIKYLPKDLTSLIESIEDIELIMSHYLYKGYSGLPHKSERSKSDQRAIIFFRMALAIYFRDKFSNADSKAFYEEESKEVTIDFFNHCIENINTLTVITTNYDLGIERVLEDINGHNSYYYPGFEQSFKGTGKIPILKLHGSINWMEERGDIEDEVFKNHTRQSVQTGILNDLTVYPFGKSEGFSLLHNKKNTLPS